ncbi:protein kinase rio1 [Kluyveromyces marxianus]|nr:protein kinase rio1 [Kluyveromyces marxianus]
MNIEEKFERLNLANRDEHVNTQILEKYANSIKTDELSITRGKTNKDKANRATVENVLDPRTMRFLKSMVNRGIISDFNGCLSTGKEANVYHAFAGNHEERHLPVVGQDPETVEDTDTTEINTPETSQPVQISQTAQTAETKNRKEYAIKIYNTSILVFKDRERYVDGEFRFRNSRSQHNPRKMIKIWAEKEFRNLKRIYQSGVIPCPKPIEIKANVLVMEFLNRGDGFASPRLKDYPYKDREEIKHYYHLMVAYMRLLYQVCRLVHADLSEYNSIIHQDKLYIIDVSQSVQPEHPMSLDFLRMDIKNVNSYFEKMGIDIFPERIIFQFIISEQLDKYRGDYRSSTDLEKYVAENLPLKKTSEDEAADEVFRSLHLIRNLGGLEERDFDRFTDEGIKEKPRSTHNLTSKGAESFDGEENNKSEVHISDSDSSESDSDDSEDEWYSDKETPLKGKKYEDKDLKKQRKQEAKEAKREKRKTKVKKHIKKKLVNKTKSRK